MFELMRASSVAPHSIETVHENWMVDMVPSRMGRIDTVLSSSCRVRRAFDTTQTKRFKLNATTINLGSRKKKREFVSTRSVS